MPTVLPMELLTESLQLSKSKAQAQLEQYRSIQLRFSRRVFLIPDLQDPNASSWASRQGQPNSLKGWVEQIFQNPENFFILNFWKEAQICPELFQLAERLNRKLLALTDRQPLDVIAIGSGNLILRAWRMKYSDLPAVHRCISIHPKMESMPSVRGSHDFKAEIERLDQVEERRRFLERIQSLIQIMAPFPSADGSSILKKAGIEKIYEQKVQDGVWNNGLSKESMGTDPRMILLIVRVLTH